MLYCQATNSTSKFQHLRSTTRLELSLPVTQLRKAFSEQPSSKSWLNQNKKDSLIRPTDLFKVFMAGHIYSTAYSKTIISQQTIRSWTTQLKMPLLFKGMITNHTGTTADMRCSRNQCQISFSWLSDPWTSTSRIIPKRSLLMRTSNWLRKLRIYQLDQWCF